LDGNHYLFFEYCDQSNLYNWIYADDDKNKYVYKEKQEQTNLRWSFLKNIVAGMTILHEARICKNDVGLGNFMLHKENDELVCKLCDFGGAELEDDRDNFKKYDIKWLGTGIIAPLFGLEKDEDAYELEAYDLTEALQGGDKNRKYAAEIVQWCMRETISERPTIHDLKKLLHADTLKQKTGSGNTND